MKKQLILSGLATAILGASITTAQAAQAADVPAHGDIRNGQAVRHDKSATLPELIERTRANSANRLSHLKAADYVYPNFTDNPERTAQGDPLTAATNVQSSFGGIPAPAIDMSFDGIGQSDAIGGGLPPDTNGDVGPDHYIQYINTDWAIYDKTTGLRIGNVEEGNTFWNGFGGPCETNNAGDPIVLYDKTAGVWVFSQFISASNPNGSQCFAISDRADMTDPGVTFNRYQFDFAGAFNDYPHIGIWTDENGDSSGYYFVTHDFTFQTNPASFLGASFSVVERDAMLAGDAAEFVRFQNVTGAGGTAYGALPAHLESDVLPAKNTCAPFVHTRADLDGYLMWNLCVDWQSPGDSTLSDAIILSSNSPYGAGVDDSPQPPPAPAGSELDSFAGNTMYRVSARAYPAESGIPIDMVINHTADAGDAVSGVKWVNFSVSYGHEGDFNPDVIFSSGFDLLAAPLDNFTAKIRDEGLYSPDDDFRWMGAISIDQSRNIGLGYSVSSENTFPSVRYTAKTSADPKGLMRDEQSCVVGSGVQTFVDGSGRAARWGDYSSMSVDPVDQCTFWLTVEYIAQTGQADWDNRICSFKVEDCGQPNFFLETSDNTDINVCVADGDPTVSLQLYGLNGFNDGIALSSVNWPGNANVQFSPVTVLTLPNEVSATFVDIADVGNSNFVTSVRAQSDNPALTRTIDLNFTVSADLPLQTVLNLPTNNAAGVSVRPTLTWDAQPDTLQYTLEIATDVDFNNVVESASIDGTAFTPLNSLDSNTVYFWRVTTSNNCGQGVTSSTFTFTTGEPGSCPSPSTPVQVFFDDLEGDVSAWTQPADPEGSTNTWTLSSGQVNSGTNAFFAQDPAIVSDQYLVSPSIVLPAGESPLTLSFWNFQNMEANIGTGIDACWDAGILEISTDGGITFNQITDDLILTDTYNGSVTAGPNPLSTLNAWCADDIVAASGDQEDTVFIDLDGFAGQTVQFRFRLGSDAFVGDEGWYIDDVEVQSCN